MICFASLHNQKNDNNQFKNKKQPELPENRTVWKSNNQGVKETFIQTGRRGREMKPGQQGRVTRQRLVHPDISHLCVDKLGETPGEGDRPHNPEFQHRKLKHQKPLWELWQWQKLPLEQESLLEGPMGS